MTPAATPGNSPPADALALLRRLTTAHHALRVDGERLIVTPRPPAELGDLIRLHKPALMEYLKELGGEVPGDPFLWEFPPPEAPVGWDGGGPPEEAGDGS